MNARRHIAKYFVDRVLHSSSDTKMCRVCTAKCSPLTSPTWILTIGHSLVHEERPEDFIKMSFDTDFLKLFLQLKVMTL